MDTNITRTFAALSATNEAILYAQSPDELYEQVCKAAFSSGDFLATAVFLLETGTDRLRLAVGFGDDIKRLRTIDVSVVAGTPEGSGVCGQAFRDQKLCASNNYLNDSHSLAWRQGACAAHVGAAAALPLTCNGRSVGVLLVTLREAGSLDEQIISLFKRLSANISYALDNFEREASRRRLSRMLAARMPDGPWLYPEDQAADAPVRILAAEITREKLFLRVHEELPYAAAVVTTAFKDMPDGSARIEQTIFVERDGQRAIVLGKGGQTLKWIGQKAREELSVLLDRRVHLFLHVQVDERWSDDRALYSQFGLDYDS